MDPQHSMTLEVDDGAELLFVCGHDGCGRRLVLGRTGGLTILDTGDFFALHHGGAPPLELLARIGD